MSGTPVATSGDLRTRIIRDPELVLGDPAIMRALVARGGAEEPGGKVVDLRSVALARIEARLGQVEAAHRTVIAAAYENLSGIHQVQRAVLCLLEARSLEDLVDTLAGEVASILRLDAIQLVLEGEASAAASAAPAMAAANDAGPPGGEAPDAALRVVPPGWVSGRVGCGGGPLSRVILRRGAVLLAEGGAAEEIGSEAWLALDLRGDGRGAGRGPGLLVLGSGDPDQFAPGQGTELMEFLAGVTERALARWLGLGRR